LAAYTIFLTLIIFLDKSNFYFRTMLNTVSITVAILFCVLHGFAQPGKIDTDRPDQTESAGTVPKKWVQFEMGFIKQSEKYAGSDKEIYFEHPTLLSKYGLTKRFELRLITTFATYRDKVNSQIIYRKNGISAVELGGKLNFFDEKGLRPKTSLIAHYDFARLRTLYKDSLDGVNFRFTLQNTISTVVSVGYNIGMEWDRFGSPPAYIYTFSPSFNISEKWYGYIEIFGSLRKNEKPENSFDGGLAYYVNPDFKLDISSGLGISKAAPDWYTAIGVSFRFNTGK
jgi:Putative MetA-pathway of phenol degradation